MQWKTLAETIRCMTLEQQETDVTIHLVEDDEFFGVKDLRINSPGKDGTAVLDDNHPYLDVELENHEKTSVCNGKPFRKET
jgi:hypothetical protein